jgi:hypothetical protein
MIVVATLVIIAVIIADIPSKEYNSFRLGDKNSADIAH